MSTNVYTSKWHLIRKCFWRGVT